MIGYVTVGTDDLKRAIAFYDALVEVLGGRRFMEQEDFVAWSGPNGEPGVAVTRPYDGRPATSGNGTMVAFQVKDRQAVDRAHARAMELGATDEGAPGPRGDSGFYAGYFRDLDGNKFNVFCI